ncbi:MAG: hypothetical protein QNL51_15245 [Opitutaceae bacterium]
MVFKNHIQQTIRPRWDGIFSGLAIFFVSCLGLVAVYQLAHRAQIEAVRGELASLARSLAVQIDGDLHRTFTSPEQTGTPEHFEALALLADFHRSNPSLFFVYTAVLRRDTVHIVLDGEFLVRNRALSNRRMISCSPTKLMIRSS